MSGKKNVDTLNYRAYHGKVIDVSNNSTLPFATVEGRR